jgi:hypothetical protein
MSEQQIDEVLAEYWEEQCRLPGAPRRRTPVKWALRKARLRRLIPTAPRRFRAELTRYLAVAEGDLGGRAVRDLVAGVGGLDQEPKLWDAVESLVEVAEVIGSVGRG